MIVPTFISCTSIILMFLDAVHGQSQRNITIYNTDPAITYLGSWQEGFYGQRYSTDTNANATFNFTGVAVYYVMSLGVSDDGDVSTLLTLDSGPTQLVNLTGSGDYAVRWSMGGLTNTKHTLVNSLGLSSQNEMARWGEVGQFIYTVQDPHSEGPHSEGNPINITSNDPRIIYDPLDAWTTNSTNVPNCALSKSGVHVTSRKGATVSFNFTGNGDTVLIHTINSPEGGQYSISINGGAEQLFDTYATSTECGISPPIMHFRRHVSAPDQDSITIKCIKPPCKFDGLGFGNSTTKPSSNSAKSSATDGSIYITGNFRAGAVQLISSILLHGFF